MTGDGILKTDTDTTMAHTASVHHGTGADTTVHTTIRIGVHGATVHGITEAATATTDSTTLGTMTHGITAAIMEATTQATGEVGTETTGVGTTHGTTTITTTAGTIHITDMVTHTSAAYILNQEATASALRQKARALWKETLLNRHSEHQAAQSEAV